MNEEYLRHECLQKSEIPKRKELLYELNYMQALVSGRLDTWFCNNFLSESVHGRWIFRLRVLLHKAIG